MWKNIDHGFIRYAQNGEGFGTAKLLEDYLGNWHLKIYDEGRLIMQLRFPKGTTTKNAIVKADDYLDDFILFKDDDDSDL